LLAIAKMISRGPPFAARASRDYGGGLRDQAMDRGSESPSLLLIGGKPGRAGSAEKARLGEEVHFSAIGGYNSRLFESLERKITF